MINSSGDFKHVLPLLGLYALAMKRIIPSVQELYAQITNIKFYKPSFDIVYNDLAAALLSINANNEFYKKTGNFIYGKEIELKDVSFSYPSSSKKIINSISMKIPVGSIVGISGSSGSGKTTLIDIILGLIHPNSGSIVLDGKRIKQGSGLFKQCDIGYVPQMGFILDDTISGNIAFGVHKDEINMGRVKEVARIACLASFIESDLQFGYETLVGERGVCLSGGQRQRLSIARSLYSDPSILIFDESTSALDGITEDKIMNNIYEISRNKTIIMIAHRLTTLMNCDTIFLIEAGRVVDRGSYKYLIENNYFFRKMAKIDKQI
jgi:ABC-type multidrug transport system fused ATPase/permease subunit